MRVCQWLAAVAGQVGLVAQQSWCPWQPAARQSIAPTPTGLGDAALVDHCLAHCAVRNVTLAFDSLGLTAWTSLKPIPNDTIRL